MSIRHTDLVELVEGLQLGDQLSTEGRVLLESYAYPAGWSPETCVEDQLDRLTCEAVEELTDREDVWSPGRAARALLAAL